MEDVNPYARNLIFVSSAFILYAVLGLTPNISDGRPDINFMFISFDIKRDEWLPYVAYILLGYTILKYEITLEQYAPKDKGLDLASQLKLRIRKTFAKALSSEGVLRTYLKWVARRQYKREPITDREPSYDGVRNKYTVEEPVEIRLGTQASVNTNSTAITVVRVAPANLLDKPQLTHNERREVDSFRLELGFLRAWPVFIISYLSFTLTPAFHSLIVPRLLYVAAFIAAIYEFVR